MGSYTTRRVLQLVPVLFVLSLVVFAIFRLLPGDAGILQLPIDATREEREGARRALGLDRPIYEQYVEWLGRVLRGDFGVAYGDTRPVPELLWNAARPTAQLALVALLIGLCLSVPLGILAAVYRTSWIDYAVRVFSLVGYSLPSFWLGVLLILVFSVRLNVFPIAGYAPLWEDPAANARHIALPATTLGVHIAAVQMRYLRSSMLDVIGQDYIRTARAKGLTERIVISRHALKNGLITFVTVVGLQFAELLGGALIVEQIFSWPGLGWMAIQSIHRREYDIVQGVVLMIGTSFVLINLAVDLLYAYLDPRIKYGAE